MSRVLSLAGFQVTLIGRFWVIPEEQSDRISHDHRFAGNLERSGYSEQQPSIQIRMVAGFVEVVEREETLVAETCNHPNWLVLPFRLELIRVAA